MSLSLLNSGNTITLINDRKELVFCAIADKDSSEAYGKAVAAGGLFLSILGLAAGAAQPAASLLVGLGGLHLAGQSAFENFHVTKSSDMVSRVLFFNDALRWPVAEGKAGIIILFHVQIHGTQVKITQYLKECSLDINYVGKIIGGDCDEKTDHFTFSLTGSHKLAHRRYLSIRDIAPHGTITKSTDWKDIPEPGSAIHFDSTGKLLNYYPQKKENHGKDLFEKCTFAYKKDSVIQLVQGESDTISTSLAVLNLADKKHTAVLRMNGWKCSYVGDKIGNALDNELPKLLDIIRDTNQRFGDDEQRYWGYQWIRDFHAKNYGSVYGLTWPHDGDSLSRTPSSQMFFVIDDKDWTYTSTIAKA